MHVTTIVVGVDGSAGAKAALAWAYEQVRRIQGARILAVSTWMSPVPAASPWFAGYDVPIDLTESTKARLDAIVHEVRAGRDGVEMQQRVVCGSAVAVLLDEGAKGDLLVVGSRGLGGFKGLLLGSVSHQLVTHAPCPTVVVPMSGSRPASSVDDPMRIVVGVDGSPNSIAALQWAGQWARATGAHVRAIYAWRLPPMVVPPAHLGLGSPSADEPPDVAAQELASFVAAAGILADVKVEAHTREGRPAPMLLEEARRADLLVVGARGHEGFTGLLLGSVATAVAHHAPCPVAVIPHERARS